MPVEYQKHLKVSLRDVGKDEKWLQDKIYSDPSILGLGDLAPSRKERKQASGGRLDMLLSDEETETMYEVEIMLGATDPSHIIRTIEYWDVESHLRPKWKHLAVIVAEEITQRFFNVIWLLNRSLPIIAIQLEALTIDGALLLHFTKVLDYGTREAPDEGTEEVVDRQYWEHRSSPEAMALFDRFMKLLADHQIHVKLNYRQDAIALAGKRNFARIIPGKSGHCLLGFYKGMSEDALKEGRDKLEKASVPVQEKSGGRFSVRLYEKTLDDNAEILLDLIRCGIKTDED